MTLSISPTPAPANAVFVLTSLGLGNSSLGAGNWLARVSLFARQPFSRRPNVAQGLDHRSAGSIVRKSVHAGVVSWPLCGCHGAERKVLRHG